MHGTAWQHLLSSNTLGTSIKWDSVTTPITLDTHRDYLTTSRICLAAEKPRRLAEERETKRKEPQPGEADRFERGAPRNELAAKPRVTPTPAVRAMAASVELDPWPPPCSPFSTNSRQTSPSQFFTEHPPSSNFYLSQFLCHRLSHDMTPPASTLVQPRANLWLASQAQMSNCETWMAKP